MNKVAWIVGVLFFLVAINSKQSSSSRTIDPWTPIYSPTQGERCDCPYDLDSQGYECGYRSAYARYGGREPQCYARDL